MAKSGRILATCGVAVLALGLILSMMSSTPESLPGVFVVAGVVLILAWPILSVGLLTEKSKGPLLKSVSLVIGALLVLLLLGFINFLASRHTLRWDATRTGRYSLSQQTKQVLGSLVEEVEALAFFQEGEGQEAEDLLEEYASASRRFSYRMIDPDRKPELAEQYKIREYGTIVLTNGARNGVRGTGHNLGTSAAVERRGKPCRIPCGSWRTEHHR